MLSGRMRTARVSDSDPRDRDPLDRDPLDRDSLEGTWTRNGDPPEGTVDWVPRQEVTSYRAPPPPWTKHCENITLPKTSFAYGKNAEKVPFIGTILLHLTWDDVCPAFWIYHCLQVSCLFELPILSIQNLPGQWRCKLGEFFGIWEMHRSWNVQAGAGLRWVVSMVVVVY